MNDRHRGFQWNHFSTIDRLAIVALAAAASLEILTLIVLPVQGYDSPNHLYWITSWHELWLQGIFYPRWLPDSFGGFGAPSFYFYPPLSYIASSCLFGIFSSAAPGDIANLLFGLALLTSGLTMWWYLRSRGTPRYTAALGAALYIFAPYRFLDFNTRAALSEHISFIFLPLVFWAADKLAERRTVLRALAVVALLSLLLLTSLPAAATMGLALVIYALAARRQEWRRNVMWLGMIGTASALLVAFYLAPIAVYYHDVRLALIWQPSAIGSGNALLDLLRGQSLRINLYNGLSFLGGCLMLASWWRERSKNLVPRTKEAALAFHREGWLLAAIVILQLPFLPTWLYYHVIPFTIIQLPPRLTILLLVLVAYTWSTHLNAQIERANNGASLTGTASSWLVAVWSMVTTILVAAQLAGVQVHPHTAIPLGDAPEYRTAWSPPYHAGSERMNSGFTNSNVRLLWSSADSANVRIISTGANWDTLQYQRPNPGQAVLHRTYWPAWHVLIDGEEVPVRPDSLGRLSFEAPAGKHLVAAVLEPTIAVRLGTWVSAGAFCCLLVLVLVNLPRHRKK